MTSAPDADVIVVGSAVAGGALANALGHLGVRVLVFEKGAERDNSTRGDILHPPTLRILDQWGVLSALHLDGTVPITQLLVTHRDLGRLASYPVPPQGDGPAGRSIALPHDRIEAVFKERAETWPTVQVERGNVVGLLFDPDGRAAGVRAEGAAGSRTATAHLVVGCDGTQSLVRRELGIEADRQPYTHELLYISAAGETDPPCSMNFNIDDTGVAMVVSRPRHHMRIAIYFERGARGDLLKRSDAEIHAYVVGRMPALRNVQFTHSNVHIYSLVRQLANRFARHGAALVGDAAHTTHPTGATGMSLAITGAARLAETTGPLLVNGAGSAAGRAALDGALQAYAAERRLAAAAAVEENHRQALRIWQGNLFKDPHAYAAAIDPVQGWGVGGAGWGQNPAALDAAATGRR